jgi:hypothetical protein
MSDNWVTKEEDEQISQEFHYLNSVDPKTGNWRDLEWMYFDSKVLDKYRDNVSCKIGIDYIIFLGPSGNVDLTVKFLRREGKLMARAKDFCFVPPRERKHWEEHRVPPIVETSEDYDCKLK